MRPSAEKSRSHRRRQTAPPAELSKERLKTEVASIDSGLKLLDVYTAALKELKERGQDAAGDIKLALDVRHAPRDWSNVEILSVMSEIIDEHPRPRLEFVLGVLGVSKVPDSLDERLRSQGAKAYGVGVRTRSLRKKKEARERQERLERERREKKEREERERREEQERKERKEREEREKLEQEKIEKERVEEEKRKDAQRKESEAKKMRGKSRRGRRGRPPTRVTATERAKKTEMNNEADDAKEPVVATHDELEKVDAMDVEAHGAKLNSKDNKTSKTGMKTEAEKAAAGIRRTRRNQSAKVEKGTTKAPLGTSRIARGIQGATTAAAPPSQENAKKDGPLPSKKGRTKAITDGSAKQKGDVATLPEAVKSEQHTTTVTNADDNERKSTISPDEPHLKKESQEATNPPDASDPRSATADAKEMATTAVNVSNVKVQSSKKATPRIIEESKIASALKESAAAVNGEVRDVHGSTAIAKDIAADVGTGAVDLLGVSEKKEVAVKEDVEEENLSEAQPEKARDAKGVPMVDDKATRVTETTKKPTELKEEVETVKTSSVGAEEKSKATKSPLNVKDKDEISKRDVVKKFDKVKETTSASATKPDTKADIRSEMAAKEGDKRSDIKSAQVEGKEGGEVEKEDFMADVFGSDEEGDKDDTEEANEKRGRRYRTRGRQSDISDSSDDAATTKRGSDEEATKEQRKRARPTGSRRMSRRMSNMRDEIVVAPSGGRMRRESRNLMKRTWELPEPDQYLLECVEVWEGIHANKISIPFREPVTVKDAPGYFDVVKQPMDLKTVKDMLQNGSIASPVEFYENLKLIVRNAFLFNDRESDLYELATELRGLIRKGTKPIVKSWKEARGLDSEESESESEIEIESVRKRGRGRPKKKAKPVKSKKKRKRGKEEEVAKSKKRRVLRRSSRTGGEDGE